MMEKLKIVIDKDPSDGIVSAFCEINEDLITTEANSVDDAVLNIRNLIADFQKNEWRNNDALQKINAFTIDLEFEYSLVSFFDVYKSIKISEIAKLAGLNAALVRAYANGDKNPSINQALKIQEATHQLAKSLLQVRLVPN